MTMNTSVPRQTMSQLLWIAVWALLLIYGAQLVWDVARFAAPWPMWVLRLLPLVLFVPSIARDNLRAVVWLCFVLLFYFISAVELVFATPDDPVAIWGVTAVVLLFVVAALYIRVRSPEQRGATAAAFTESKESNT